MHRQHPEIDSLVTAGSGELRAIKPAKTCKSVPTISALITVSVIMVILCAGCSHDSNNVQNIKPVASKGTTTDFEGALAGQKEGATPGAGGQQQTPPTDQRQDRN